MTEKHKRYALAGIMVLVAIYFYVSLLISPTLAETERIQRELGTFRERVRTASSELRSLELKQRVALRDADVDQRGRELLKSLPTPYMVTTVPILTNTLEDHLLANPKIKLFMVVPFRGLADYTIATWIITVPEASSLHVGGVVADLENRFPLGRLSELVLELDSATGTVGALIAFQTVVHP